MSDSEIKDFINKQNSLSTLRYITCGSVDDGKSTLLGRMLYEAQLIFDDQIDSLIKDSKNLLLKLEEIRALEEIFFTISFFPRLTN